MRRVSVGLSDRSGPIIPAGTFVLLLLRADLLGLREGARTVPGPFSGDGRRQLALPAYALAAGVLGAIGEALLRPGRVSFLPVDRGHGA